MTETAVGPWVIGLIRHDDGNGPVLFAGGDFRSIDEVPANRIARWQLCPSGTPCPADLTADGVVNELDLLAILKVWGSCSGCPEDLTGDGVVDLSDLLMLLSIWGPCSQR